MSLIHNRHSASVNAAITLSEIEYQESECSTEKTAIDDKASIIKQDVYELESYNDQKGFQIEETESILSKKKRKWLVIRRVSYIIIMNAALPIALYYVLKPYLPIVWALVLSSTPTIISVIVQAIFLRKIDSIGVAVIFGKKLCAKT
jgi:hypothetical protein